MYFKREVDKLLKLMHKLLYLLFLSAFTLVACSKEGLKKEDLIGNWSLVNGTLNGQPAAQFEGFTIQFSNDSLSSIIVSQMSDNNEATVPYTLVPENKIQMQNVPVAFKIEKLANDTLSLTFDMQRDGDMFTMQMTFKRQ